MTHTNRVWSEEEKAWGPAMGHVTSLGPWFVSCKTGIMLHVPNRAAGDSGESVHVNEPHVHVAWTRQPQGGLLTTCGVRKKAEGEPRLPSLCIWKAGAASRERGSASAGAGAGRGVGEQRNSGLHMVRGILPDTLRDHPMTSGYWFIGGRAENLQMCRPILG